MTFSVTDERFYDYDEETRKLVAKDSFASITSGPYSIGLDPEVKDKKRRDTKRSQPNSPTAISAGKPGDFMVLDEFLDSMGTWIFEEKKIEHPDHPLTAEDGEKTSEEDVGGRTSTGNGEC